MKNIPRMPKKMISMLIPADLYEYAKEHCEQQGITLTWFTLEALIHKLELETNSTYKKFKKID